MTVFHYPGGLRVGLRKEQAAAPLASAPLAPARRILESKRMLMIVMQGQQRFRLDGMPFLLSSYLPHDPGPKAVFLQLKAGQWLEYTESIGTPLIKLSVTMGEDWLEQAGSLFEEPNDTDLHIEAVADLPSSLFHHIWRISAEMAAIAQDIIQIDEDFHAGRQSRNAMTLGLMARGVDLLRAALRDLGTARAAQGAPSQSRLPDPRLERLTAYIAAHLEDPALGPVTLAQACGMSLRSLQRLCRTALDCNASTFIRRQRMEAAFTALSWRRLNVQQAAFMAGYSNAANFSTAFKRLFGLTPKQVYAQR